MAKQVTGMNISGDAKNLIKACLEQEVVRRTKAMEAEVKAKDPQGRTLLDTQMSHLSVSRIKAMMAEHTGLRVGTSAAVTMKDHLEHMIRRLIREGEAAAMKEGLHTIKARHLKAGGGAEPDGGVGPEARTDASSRLGAKDDYISEKRLEGLVRGWTDLPVDAEALSELRSFIEDDLANLVARLQDTSEPRQAERILGVLMEVQGAIAQPRIRSVILAADDLARSRGLTRIRAEEIVDAYGKV